ncbi:MAG TPA: hypothetical protein VHZ26_19520 [Caulobacteraceae bacterium]|jgi:hypothetical protein|nr:hypothetical protein [Caulobacteraceae bacterium]
MSVASLRHAGTREPTSPDRVHDLVAGGLLAVLAIGLGWGCVSQLMADGLVDASPAAVLHWRPNDPDALAAEADARLRAARTSADIEQAAGLARRALVEAPLAAAPLRILGFSAQRQGRPREAQALMAAAGARSHRDLLTQAWLFDDALSRDDYPAAFDRADAMLRLDDGMDTTLYPLIIDAASDPRAVPPLVWRLAAKPLWRPDFLRALAAGGDPDLTLRVLGQLKQTSAPPTDEEAGFLVGRLIHDGAYARAYQAWASLLPAKAPLRPGGLYDGDFAPAPGATPFNWRLNPNSRVVAERSSPPSGPPTGLYVRFTPTITDELASETLLLAPGAYRLTGQVMFETPAEAGQFRLALLCADGTGQPMLDAGLGGDPGAWRAISLPFDVAPSGCAAQRLQIVGRAGDSFDPVGAWFTGLAVQPSRNGAQQRAGR